MYTKILAQGDKFGSGATGLDNPASTVIDFRKEKNFYNLVKNASTY